MYNRYYHTNRSYMKFPDKGVEILIPPQSKSIKVSAGIIDDWDTIKDYTEGYKPGREVINFEVVDNSGQVITKFDPAIELKVYFTANDVKFAGGNLDDLKLAFLPVNDSRWIIFTEQKHDLERHLDYWPPPTEGDLWIGYFKVKIFDWGDPSVSVGK